MNSSLAQSARDASPSSLSLTDISIMDAIQTKRTRVNLREVFCLVCPGRVLLCARWIPLWLKTEANSKLRVTSSQLKAIPLHSGSLALSCWSQNKDSQSNHEERWVGRAAEGKRWREAEKGMWVCTCAVHEREWVGDMAVQHQSYELGGPWVACRGVCVSKKPESSCPLHPLSERKTVRDVSACFFSACS